MNRASLIGVSSAFLCQVVLLVIAGSQNRLMIGPDSVVYIRIASYYFNGQFDLMVSGYWGPMISWLIALFLLIVKNPLDAARIVMGLSAVAFLLASVTLLRRLNVPTIGIIMGAWLVALSSVIWSIQPITPDLLLATFVCFAVAWMMSPNWLDKWQTQLAAGILWGAAYLAKPVGLPLSLGVTIVIGVLYLAVGATTLKTALRSMAITVCGIVLLAGPWIVALSLKYHRILFSTSGALNHAIMGPRTGTPGYHPAVLHPPEPGRLLWFEDPPSQLYERLFWSPFESLEYAKFQLKLVYLNFDDVIQMLSLFDWLHLAISSTVLAFVVHTPWRENMFKERWRWSAAVIACLGGIYLPVFAYADRYYYAAYPFLIAASVGFVLWLTQQSRHSIPRLAGLLILLLSFGNPIRRMLPEALNGIDYPQSRYARDLADRLRNAGLQGPLAGAGSNQNQWRGEQMGPYLALFTNQPYVGSEAAPSSEDLKASGARVVVFDRALQLSGVKEDPAFRDLDNVLFESKEEAEKYPLKVYQVDAK